MDDNNDVLGKLHRASLSEVDKALLKLGVLDEHGRVSGAGEKVVIGFLMAEEGFKNNLADYLAPLWRKGKGGQDNKGEQTASQV